VIVECQAWLEQLAKDNGVKDFAEGDFALSQQRAAPNVTILWGRETYRRSGTRVAAEDAVGGRTRTIRRKLFVRKLPGVLVIKADRTDGKPDGRAGCEALLKAYLLACARGPMDADGNRLRVRPGPGTWYPDKAASATLRRVELQLEFEGGVFEDEQRALIADVAPEPDGE